MKTDEVSVHQYPEKFWTASFFLMEHFLLFFFYHEFCKAVVLKVFWIADHFTT